LSNLKVNQWVPISRKFSKTELSLTTNFYFKNCSFKTKHFYIKDTSKGCWGKRRRGWFRHCDTSRKVAGSIPDGVNGIFHLHNPSGRTMASKRNEYQKYFLEVKAAGV
jgi:hypothetical protein